MSQGKRYGLILPTSVARRNPMSKSASVFDDDDDEDLQSFQNQHLKKDEKKIILKRQMQLQMEKAMADDPTVYEYDSIYDDLQAKKASFGSGLSSKSSHKQPKYIGNLMKAAEDRKKEMERRAERKIHNQRQAERGKYDDKEAFVTEAYRQKMEQMRQEEENEQKKEQLEALMDVTKQSDLSGFYRNLLKQTVGEEPITPSAAVVKYENETWSADEVASSRERGHCQRRKSDNRELQEREKFSRHRSRRATPDISPRKYCDSQCKHENPTDRNYEDDCGIVDRNDEFSDKEHAAYGRTPCKERPNVRSDCAKKRGKEIKTHCDDVSKEKRPKISEIATSDEPKISHLNIVKRTTGSCLDDARARFLARRATMKVPFVDRD